MKQCTKCGRQKDENEFYKHLKTRDGFETRCKACLNQATKERRKNNRERYNEQCKKWRRDNREKVQKSTKKWYRNNKEKAKEYSRGYYQNNTEKAVERKRKWRQNNRERCNKYYREWRQNDSAYRLNTSMSAQIRGSLKTGKAGRHWEDLVGYTVKALKKHLESQFEDWMNWDNYGEWHIDHIIPMSYFSFKTPEDKEFRKCWGLDNLQPLVAHENLSKSNKYIG